VALHAGRPDFGVLQSRMHVRRPPARLLEDAPVQLYGLWGVSERKLAVAPE
jgi:hypothetical protein